MKTPKAFVMAAVMALLVLSPEAVSGWGDRTTQSSLSPGVPTKINFQGRLTDATGHPLTGTYTMKFRLYNALTAGTLLWGPETQGVTVTDGLFNALLGDVNPLSASLFTSSTYLEVEVDGQILSPRQQIVSVAHAFQTDNADMVDGKHASDFASASLIGGSNAHETDTYQDLLLSMSTTGWVVRDDGDTDYDHTLIVATTGWLTEYTLWYGGTVVHGEASVASPATITFPHYQAFQLILARYEHIASLVCNENDAEIGCVYQKSHP